jgi:hypothetical protein
MISPKILNIICVSDYIVHEWEDLCDYIIGALIHIYKNNSKHKSVVFYKEEKRI